MGVAYSPDAAWPGSPPAPARAAGPGWRTLFTERPRVTRGVFWTLFFAHVLVAHLVLIVTTPLAAFPAAAFVALVVLDAVLLRHRGARPWPPAVWCVPVPVDARGRRGRRLILLAALLVTVILHALLAGGSIHEADGTC